ncbi:MAG: RNase adapter RapZ [Alphaproteobacteria bacterium]|nr:RNase adapter RapZ [Alphaproteobacteria bacterium]
MTNTTRVMLVTGMSGAGKSTVLHLLEDLGYEAIDNIPLALLRNLLTPVGDSPLTRHDAIAVGIDIRTRDFGADRVAEEVYALRQRSDLSVQLVFMDCDEDVLARRYTETRRRHPLAEDRRLVDGLHLERERIGSLRDRADVVIDTTMLSVTQLRQLIGERFRLLAGPGLTVTVISFAYRRGLPREADLVFDVRFLANPHYDPALQPLTGLDAAVGRFVEADPAYAAFFASLSALLGTLLPNYTQEGKTYLTIGVGCSGGQHRSVHVAERVAAFLRDRGVAPVVRHRDLPEPVRDSSG